MTILDRVREDIENEEETNFHLIDELLKEDALLKQVMLKEMYQKNENLKHKNMVYDKCIYPYNELYYGW